MPFNIFLINIIKRLRAISGRGVLVAMWVAALTAAVQAIKVSYMWGYLSCRNSAEYLDCLHIYDRHGNYSEQLNFQRFEITILLSIFVIGLLLRKYTGFLLSLISLFWIGKIYLSWRLYTAAFLKAQEIPDYSLLEGLKRQQLDFLLRDATLWDITVLAICFMLLLWQAKLLLTVIRSTR